MTDEEGAADKFEKLRREAEEKLSDAIESTDGVSNEDAPGIKGLLHELQVHQVELELQNEELRETRIRLRKMKGKYVDLYHSAPISYLTLNEEGEVLDANLTSAKKLQTQKECLIGGDFYSYVVEEDRDTLFKHLREVFKTEKQRSCELRLAPGADGSAPEEPGGRVEEEFHGLMESKVFENGESEAFCRTALSDITERKGLELELKKSEQQYRSLFNSIRDAILVADIDRKIINCNPAFTELFGYVLEEIEGEKTEYLYHDQEEYERMGEEIKESLGDPNFFYTIHYEKKDGQVFPGETNVFYLRDDEGEVVGFIGLIRNISERIAREEALKHSEKKYRTVFENTGTGMIIVEEDTTISLANEKMVELTGYSREEIEGNMNWTELLTGDEHLEKMREWHKDRRDIPSTAPKRYEFKLVDIEGKEKDVLVFVDLIPGTKKSVASLIDITERKKAEREIREQKERFRSYVENSPLGIFITDGQGNYVQVNGAASSVTGYHREELLSMNIVDLIPEEHKAEAENQFRLMVEKGEVDTKLPFLKKDGSYRYWNVKAVKLSENRFLGFVNDVTEREEMENQINEDRERLRQSFVQIAETTSRVLGVRDPYTQQHEQRVAELAQEVGKRMGLKEEKLLGLYIGGVLHDIGKIAIPETILTKPGELKDIEWKMIKSHPKVGHDQILKDTDFPWPVAEMTLHHHERLDGSGYPDGLEGSQLTIEVRILGAVDVVEAMSTRRPYRDARTKERTLNVIKEGKGDKFDPKVVDILVEMIEEGEVEFGGE